MLRDPASWLPLAVKGSSRNLRPALLPIPVQRCGTPPHQRAHLGRGRRVRGGEPLAPAPGRRQSQEGQEREEQGWSKRRALGCLNLRPGATSRNLGPILLTISLQTCGKRGGQPQDLRGPLREGQGVLRRDGGEDQVRSRRVRRSGPLKGQESGLYSTRIKCED